MTAPAIYSSISRLAVRNAKATQVSALRQVQEQFRKAANDASHSDLVYFNAKFHHLLGEMADNQYLQPTYQRLQIDHARIAQTFYQTQNTAKDDRVTLAVSQHDQLIAAIDAGDEEEAVRITVAHWNLSASQADIFVRPDPLPMDE